MTGAIVTFTPNPALDVSTRTERVVPTKKLRCGDLHYDPGGGGINVARAITFLGGKALAVFAAGGASGKTLKTLLDREGVATRPVKIAGSTREDLTVDETQTGQQFRFVMPGPKLSPSELEACLDVLRDLVPKPAYLVASGSLPDGAPPDFYGRVTDIAHALGAKMVLDTSGPALQAAVRHGGIHLLKPSHSELEALAGKALPDENSQAQAAALLVERGAAEIIVVSLGARGAMIVTSNAIRTFPAIPVAVQSTIGAGDSMVAGIVLSMASGRTLDESLRFGTAAAAAALLRPGTSLCRREDVERLYAAGTEGDQPVGDAIMAQ